MPQVTNRRLDFKVGMAMRLTSPQSHPPCLPSPQLKQQHQQRQFKMLRLVKGETGEQGNAQWAFTSRRNRVQIQDRSVLSLLELNRVLWLTGESSHLAPFCFFFQMTIIVL